jgi:potassium efflux system protein
VLYLCSQLRARAAVGLLEVRAHAIAVSFVSHLIRRLGASAWSWRAGLRCLLVLSCVLVLGAARAEPDDNPDAVIDGARKTLETLQRQLQSRELSDAQLVDMRRTLLAMQQQAEDVIEQQTQQLQGAQDRLAGLGPAASSPAAEAPDVAAQRQSLEQSSSEIEARVKLARLLIVESEQVADEVAVLQRKRFRDELFERTDSLLSAAFWTDLRASWHRDWIRLGQLAAPLRAPPPGRVAWGVAGGLALVAMAVALRRALGRWLDRFVTQRIPQGRLRRSFFALARSLLAILLPGAVAYALLFAFRQAGLKQSWETLLGDALGAVCFSAYVVGLGRSLLLAKRPSWRLLPLPDHLAHGLSPYPLLLGWAVFASWLLQRLGALVQTGLSTAVAIDALVTLALGLILVRAVSRAERLRGQVQAPSSPATPARPWWLSMLIVALWLLLVLSLAAILIGYVALGSFVVRQAVWITVLAGSAYLLCAVVDDAATAWQARPAADVSEDDAAGRLDAASGRRAQVAVLASGALRLLVVLMLLILLLAPFGEGPSELLGHTSRLGAGITVGALELRPASVLQAVLVFMLTLGALRVLQHWLASRYLPTTSLDAGMRSSLVTLLGFVGLVVAVALALSAVGLALDKVAWIASALTVGVGFGMQAVVSNFVSGLILLAERPVKVGDWVALGGVEGDIRRINVRATEIRMGDRSTVIVPNSEFITKVVRNVTHDNPLGLVQVKLPLPLDVDVDRVRELLLQAFQAHEEVLQDPPPNVLLDGVEGDKLVFNATGFVSSPRKTAATRSALLFKVMGELRRMRQTP